MNRVRVPRWSVAAALIAILVAGTFAITHTVREISRIHVLAYFPTSTGVYVGDDVRIRGVKVGTIDRIEPQPTRVKISFWFDRSYKVPADAKAVILSPTLVTARAIQLTPPYRSGPTMSDNTIIPDSRTAVPVEWDDVRSQLEKLTKALQPTQPGGVSTLGELVNTTADNLRGQGASIRDSIIKLSQAVSTLGDHSGDTFSSLKNVATLVSALQGSTDLLRQLNRNLASVTGLLANNPDEVANAVNELNDAVGKVKTFIVDNQETLGITAGKLTSVSQTLTASLDDIKQILHTLPTTATNGLNLYQPAQGALTGVAAINNFSDPITFLCGGIQAASRLRADQSAKLCVQYLAPILKNRQYNFLPLGFNPFVGAAARPNELTYSEDRLRPDYVPPQAQPPSAAPAAPALPPTHPTDPAAGLSGLMVPTGAGQ